MRFTVEITQHIEVETLTETQVRGEDLPRICELCNIKPKKDWEKREFVTIMVPGKKETGTVVFKQSVPELDLSAIVTLVNTPKKEV